MCNERERLIGYVYDECDAAERSAVQQHLDACAECQTEIAALRSVREDLQAWDVTDHESVWKPFVPAPAPAWWQQVPRWAMAAAAGAVIVSGAAGGAVATAIMQPAATVVASSAPAGATQVSLTGADLAELERRMEARLQSEVNALNGRVQLASSRTPAVGSPSEAALHAAYGKQIADLRAINDRQIDAINAIYNNLGQIKLGFDTRHAALATRVNNIQSVLQEK